MFPRTPARMGGWQTRFRGDTRPRGRRPSHDASLRSSGWRMQWYRSAPDSRQKQNRARHCESERAPCGSGFLDGRGARRQRTFRVRTCCVVFHAGRVYAARPWRSDNLGFLGRESPIVNQRKQSNPKSLIANHQSPINQRSPITIHQWISPSLPPAPHLSPGG